jgi:ubiquinone/menaquinone biosynthesis C-methylase UbiE
MTPREIRAAQFELEKELRLRILNSRPEDRFTVTAGAYATLFETFPGHFALSEAPADRTRAARRSAGMILPLTAPGQCVLEVGSGRGDVLRELSNSGLICTGIEPSQHMICLSRHVPRITVLRGTADRLLFPDASLDLVFSQQVLEHMHPHDVPRHFAEAHRVLRARGLLAIETPNRRTGPQDVSRGFAAVAEGLHLKEWSVRELIQQFQAAGFTRLRGLLAPPCLARRSAIIHRLSRVPARVKYFEDLLLACLPHRALRTLTGKVLGLDDIFLIGEKPAPPRPTAAQQPAPGSIPECRSTP